MPYLWGALQNQLLQSRKKGTTWAICLIIKYVADAAISGIVNDHGAEIRVKMRGEASSLCFHLAREGFNDYLWEFPSGIASQRSLSCDWILLGFFITSVSNYLVYLPKTLEEEEKVYSLDNQADYCACDESVRRFLRWWKPNFVSGFENVAG